MPLARPLTRGLTSSLRRSVGAATELTLAEAFAGTKSDLRNWFRANTGSRLPINPTPLTGVQAITTQPQADALKGRKVSGRITIGANNISLTDFECEWDGTGTGSLLVEVLGGFTGITISHFKLDGKYANISYGVGGTTFSTGCTVTNGEILHIGGDAVRTFKNSTYRHLYCHSFRPWDTAVDGVYDPNGSQTLYPHTDAIQTIRSGNVVEECWFENTPAQNATSACIIKVDTDESITSFTMRRCYIDGGGVVFYIDNLNSDIDNPGAFGQPSGIVFEDILVGRNHREARTFRHDEVPSANITKTNVRYADTGLPVESTFVDDFNRANESLETRYFDRVSGVAGQLAINANQVQSVSIAAQGTYLLQTAFGVDLVNHFVEADWKSGTTTGWLLARYAGEADYIGMQILASIPTLYKRVGGTFTVLGAGVTSLTAGDKIRIECFETSIRLFHKGVLRITANVTDPILQSGRVGLQSRTTIANPMLDNFAAGGLLA
jgi:hypothetical protein